jgi:hypothetical protein
MVAHVSLITAAREMDKAIQALELAQRHLNDAAFPGRYSMRLLIADLKRLRDMISNESAGSPASP